MHMKRFAVACTLVVLGTVGCSAGSSHSERSSGRFSTPASTANSSSAAATKSPGGTLVIVADPCVGAGLSPGTHYYPVVVSVRNGSHVVFQATIAGGRERRLPLPEGLYIVSARYDQTVRATVTAGGTATAHLINGCK